MADQDAKAPAAGGSAPASAGTAKPAKPPNPVWRMMGLPSIRWKLPSRNWMIFLTITGSWSAAVYYDRRQKKRIQKKWTKLVEHIAQESVDTQQLPRKITVYVSAPPSDGLVPARDHFHEYVKPILVAAALDWDAVEGRREGDVRAGLAERIRRLRKRMGETSKDGFDEKEELELILEATRQKAGVKEWNGTEGDIVIGRNTLKEYVRGLHEGWLGPIDAPDPPAEVTQLEAPQLEQQDMEKEPSPTAGSGAEGASGTSTDDASPATSPETPPQEPEKPKAEENKPKKKKQPPPFINTADYTNAPLAATCPSELGPTAVIPFPHLLGFFNFPIRMYRFLNQRKVADDIGRQTAAAVLAAYRPYEAPGEQQLAAPTGDGDDDSAPQWEQQQLLRREEPEWHKSVRDCSKDEEGKERVWLDDMVLDPRIAARMRRFVLSAEEEERAKRIALEKDEPWWKTVWPQREHKKQNWELIGDDEA